MGVSQNELASSLRVAPGRINETVNKKRGLIVLDQSPDPL